MSKKISEMGAVTDLLGTDMVTALDLSEPVATQNVKITKDNLLKETAKTADLGSAALLDVGTGSGDVAAGDAPAAAVTTHESTYNHANLPTTAQKGALNGNATLSSGNPVASRAEIAGGVSPATREDVIAGASIDTPITGKAYTVALTDGLAVASWTASPGAAVADFENTCSVDFIAPPATSASVAIDSGWQQMGVSGPITLEPAADPVSVILRTLKDGTVQIYRSETGA